MQQVSGGKKVIVLAVQLWSSRTDERKQNQEKLLCKKYMEKKL